MVPCHRPLPLAFLALILAVATTGTHAANPLSKLFMMKRKDNADGAPANSPSPAVASSGESICIPPQALDKAESQLQSVEDSRDKAVRMHKEALGLAEKYRVELEDYRKTTEVRLQQLAQASESTQQVAQVQEEFGARLLEMQEKADRELAEAKTIIAEKEQELNSAKAEHARALEAAVQSAEQRVQSTEAEWKQMLSNAERGMRQNIQSLQSEFDSKTKQQEQEKAILLDEKNAALADIAQLKEEHERVRQLKDEHASLTESSEASIQLMKSDFDSKLQQHEQEKAILLDEKNASLAAIEQMKKQHEQVLKDHAAALKQTLKDLDSSAASKSSTEEIEKLKDELASQKASSEASIQTMKLDFDAKTKQHEQEKSILLDAKTAALVSLAQLREEHEQLLRDHAEALEQNSVYKATGDHAEEVQQLKDELASQKESSDASIAKMTAALEAQQASAEATIRQLKTDLGEAEAELVNVKSSHEKIVEELTEKLRNSASEVEALTAENLQKEADLRIFKKKYLSAAKDASYWESLYEKRSYFNLTHMAGDAVSFADKTKRETSKKLSELGKQAAELGKQAAPVAEKVLDNSKHVYEKHVVPSAIKSKELFDVHMKPQVDKATKLYDVHMKPQVDIAAEKAFPIYNAHVAPLIKTAKVTTVDLAESAFDTMSTQFEAFCPTALETLKSMEAKTGVSLPASMHESAEYSCQHPDEEVTLFLQGLVLLIAIIMHRTIFRVVWGTIRLVISIAFFPLRLFLSLFRKSPSPPPPPKEAKKKEANGNASKATKNGKK